MTLTSRGAWGLVCAVSLGIHLVSLQQVAVTVAVPAITTPPSYGELIFLGAIAGPVEPVGPAAGSVAQPPAASEPPTLSWYGTTPEPPALSRDLPQALHLLQEPTAPPPRVMPSKLFAQEKQYPQMVTRVALTPRSTTAPVWIRGPARHRELISRPPLPPYLTRVPLTRLRSQTTPRTIDLQLRFTLTAGGQVDHVELLQSSGDPLLDLVGLQYLKDWRFAAVNPRDVRHVAESWGQVTLRLDLEPSAANDPSAF